MMFTRDLIIEDVDTALHAAQAKLNELTSQLDEYDERVEGDREFASLLRGSDFLSA